VIVVQTKGGRLDCGAIGQAIFSPLLIRRTWNPSSLRSVIVCTREDALLSSVLPNLPQQPKVELHIRASEGLVRVPKIRYRRAPAFVEQYWRQRGGTLVTNYPLMKRDGSSASRKADALLLLDGPSRRASPAEVPSLEGQRVEVIVSVPGRNGMYSAGAALVNLELVRRRGARAARAVILCRSADAAMAEVLTGFTDIGVEAMQPAR
jgi:hypothetical protein